MFVCASFGAQALVLTLVCGALHAKIGANNSTDCAVADTTSNDIVSTVLPRPGSSCDAGGQIWRLGGGDGEHHGTPLTAVDVLEAWVSSCAPEDVDECRRLATDASWLFRCSRQGLMDSQSTSAVDERLAFLLLRRAAELSAADVWRSPKVFEESVPCRRPTNSSEVRKRFDQDLLDVSLSPGRICEGGECSNRCGVIVLDNVTTAEESEALVAHGEAIFLKHQAKTLKNTQERKSQVDLHLSAQHGEKTTHILFLFVLERLRRLVALAANVPLSWVQFASHFLSRGDVSTSNHVREDARAEGSTHQTDASVEANVAGSVDDVNHTSTVHCDESSFARFHHSGVLWLTPQDNASGGEVEFWDADQRVWRRTFQPLPGRVVLFTSGWENIHRVTALRRGRRWSLPLFASLQPPLNATRLAKACVWPKSSKQWQYCEDRLHQWWSSHDDELY